MAQCHSVVTVFLLALHSLSATQPQRHTASAKEYPNQLKCEEEVCTSGHPALYPVVETAFFCEAGKPGFKTYTNCEILKLVEYTQGSGFAYAERILVDITALANGTSSQHEQVLEELNALRGRLAVAAVLSFTQLAIVVVYLIITGVLFIKK